MCFTQYEEFDDETGETTYRSQIDGEGEFLDRLFVTGCFVASSTALFRREAIARRARGFRDVDFSFGDDYFLWLTLLIDSRAVLVDDVLARLRRHSGNESARLGLDNSELRALRLLEEFLEHMPIARVMLGEARRRGSPGTGRQRRSGNSRSEADAVPPRSRSVPPCSTREAPEPTRAPPRPYAWSHRWHRSALAARVG